MFKIAICDDCVETIQKLKILVDGFFKRHHLEASIMTYKDGLELISEKIFFDAIFLDIDMPEMNGLKTAKTIRTWDKNVFIVYVTSYPDYKNFAFTVHAFGYIQKPIIAQQIDYYLSEMINYQKETLDQKILNLKTQEGFLKINANDIYYFEYINRKVKIVSKKGIYYSSYKIGELYEKLNMCGFDMPHKSFVVNLLQVYNVKGFEIQMMNGDRLPLAQKKASFFKKNLNNCLQETFESI